MLLLTIAIINYVASSSSIVILSCHCVFSGVDAVTAAAIAIAIVDAVSTSSSIVAGTYYSVISGANSVSRATTDGIVASLSSITTTTDVVATSTNCVTSCR